jgi:transcriptional regulator with XRE-family HTH domain
MLSSVIRELRERAGWSQEELARRAGVSQQLIGKIERDKVRESRKLPLIARAFGITVDQLLAAVRGKQPANIGAPANAESTWPFAFDRRRFDGLSNHDKARVEGAALMVILEIESHQNAARKRRPARNA